MWRTWKINSLFKSKTEVVRKVNKKLWLKVHYQHAHFIFKLTGASQLSFGFKMATFFPVPFLKCKSQKKSTTRVLNQLCNYDSLKNSTGRYLPNNLIEIYAQITTNTKSVINTESNPAVILVFKPYSTSRDTPADYHGNTKSRDTKTSQR